MITGRTNPLLKKVRALRQSRGRRKSGLFLIEGLHQVAAAIEAGWEIETLLYSPELLSSRFGQDLISRFDGKLEELSARALASVAEKEHPQGILAIAKQHVRTLRSVTPSGCSAALVSAQDPGNVGTVLRTLDAVGGTALYLIDGGVDPYHPTTIRAAMGATFTIPMVEASFGEFLNWCTSHRVQLIGSSAHVGLNFQEARPIEPWILLLGSEQKGLSKSQKDACAIVVSVPMRGRSSSLNLAVAAGILLYAYAD